MFEALLDPRSIQWMLLLGGGLCVLGIIVWLVSKGVFENKLVLAATLGAGTLAILGSGWITALKTRYRLAGQALTFLGCVVAPLNLWFYQAQKLVTIDDHLWVGGVACCLLYAATVWVLRDPLFMFACEAGITLTALLLLADLGKITDITWLSLFLMALGLISIHAERAFSPAEESEFPRRRYGLPLFWSGQTQIGVALVTLLGSQLASWLKTPAEALFGLVWSENLLTTHHLVAAGIWLAAVYAYLYSDLVVRRLGVYLALAGASLIMAEITLLLGYEVRAEWIMTVMAATSVAVNIAHWKWNREYHSLNRFEPLAWLLATIPVVWGIAMHLRATNATLQDLTGDYATTGLFVAVMATVAGGNRVSAWLVRMSDTKSSAAYYVLSAAAVFLAAAGELRVLGYQTWSEQAPWMMLIPIAYLVASRFWQGHTAERPLYWVAQGGTALVLWHVLSGVVYDLHTLAPSADRPESLVLAMVFGLAAGFYLLAAVFEGTRLNDHLAAIAACGSLWQLMGYHGIDPAYFTTVYAALGLAILGAGRIRIAVPKTSAQPDDADQEKLCGLGAAACQWGNGILCIALLAAFMQGLFDMARHGIDWTNIGALALTIGTGALAAVVSPTGNWRRFFGVASTSLGVVWLLQLNMLIDLTAWQKVEVVSVVLGVITLIGSHLAAFREPDDVREDSVSMGLGLGSMLAVVPLVIAVLHHRWVGAGPSLVDELALLTVTVLMTVTGIGWQFKSTTMWGGSALVLYLVVLVSSLAYHPQVAVGVYLAAGGAGLFLLGIALSVYREKLLELPQQVVQRKGLFRILGWR
jgi:hypothetical protein